MIDRPIENHEQSGPPPQKTLTSLVEVAAQDFQKTHPDMDAISASQRGYLIYKWSIGTAPSAVEFREALAKDSSLANLARGWIDTGNGGLAIFDVVPPVLLNAALRGEPIQTLIDSARQFALSGTTTVETYTAIVGPTLSTAVNLQEELELLPWSDVPDLGAKSSFDEAANPQQWLSQTFVRMAVAPTMALRHRDVNRKVLFDSYDAAPKPGTDGAITAQAKYEAVQDVVRCIVAVCVSPAARLGSWSQLENSFAARAITLWFDYSHGVFDMALSPSSKQAIDGEVLAELYRKFIRLPPPVKATLRIGLDRLALAVREPDPVDKAIDLGISLEALLLHGVGGDSDKGELKYRAAVRGATFLGGNKEERLSTFKLLKAAYDARSAAVHTGSLGTKKIAGMETREILERTAAMCAKIAARLVDRGSFPNWERDYVMGGD